MKLSRLFSLAALAAALALGTRAEANYTVFTAIDTTSIVFNGVAIPASALTIDAPNTMVTIAPSQTVLFPNGGASYTSPGNGETVYFFNTVGPPASVTSAANLQIFVGTNGSTASYTDVVAFRALVQIDPLGGTNFQPAFTQTVPPTFAYTININSGQGSIQPPPNPGNQLLDLPPTVTVGSSTFSIGVPSASIGTANSASGNANIGAAITLVPEPTSVVMLGAGLVGVVGLGLRRARKRA